MKGNLLKILFTLLLLNFCHLLPAEEPMLHEASCSTQTLSIKLSDGDSYVAERIQSQIIDDVSFNWSGRLTSGARGYLTFAKVQDVVRGTLTIFGGKAYNFKGTAKDLTFEEVVKIAECGGCSVHQEGVIPRDPRMGAQPEINWKNGDANLIDLLFVYPDEVTAQEGSDANVRAAIHSAVADSNLCLRNSLVSSQFRVVHMEEVTYDPTGNLDTDLSRLKDSTDGFMDNVHSLRNTHGADIVCMLTTDGGSLGGLASTLTYPSLDFAEHAFNVNVISQIGAPSYTLAHEIGHNLGCLHNREDVNSSRDYSNYDFAAFCYGKRWETGGNAYRTVMSYNATPPNYQKLPYFSNPSVFYEGVATGNAGSENNAKVLQISSAYAANFRQSVVQSILPSQFSVSVDEGNFTSFGVRLGVKPVSAVTVALNLSGDSDLMLGSQSTLSFDASNWSLYQTVTVVGVNDVDEVNGSASLTFSAEGITSQLVDVVEKDSGNNSQTGYFFSGIVVNSYGVGIAGAQINFPGAGVSQTNEDGAFYISLPNGWSGSASISAAGYTFSPASHTISSLSAHSLGFISQGTRSNILYVDQDATGSGDGTSWNDAYVDLSAALLSRNPFTEVWVAEGTYLPGVIRASGFVLPPNVPVYGGFSGTESSRAERNATDYPTILSGDIGVLNDSSDNAYNVVIPSNGSLLDGFTIRDGNASKNYGDARGWGAGIFADGISFSVANCTITHNRARSRGGAVFLLDANATFSNCTFSNNYGTAWAEVNSYGYAGAIDLNNTTLILEQCVFTNNQADLNGGAIYGKNSDINATSCTFSNNQNTDNNGGGAMYLLDSNLTLQGSDFQSNLSASSSGGAIYFNGGNHVVRDSNFTSNQSNSRGGSLYLIDGNLTLRESVFSSNSSPLDGGAIYAENSDINSSNCKFNSNQNTSNNGGGAISMSAGTLTDLNSTFATNSSNSSNPSAASWGGALAIQSVIAILEKSTFSHNTSTKSGGAIYSSDSNLTLLNGSFQSNESSTGAGGAVYSSDSNLTINDSSFHQNYATSSSGGAISVDETSDISLLDNIFKMNSASFGGAVAAKCPNLRITGGSFVGNWANTGGGIYTQDAVASYLENIIALGNEANATASAQGGFAFFNTGSLGSKFINCVIVGNKSSSRNGVFRPTGATHFINCTIVNNEATSEGGVTLLFDGDSVALENTIMWGNTAGTGNDIYVNSGTASANFSLFDPGQSIGTITGTPVSSSDPLFIDANGTDNVYGTEDDDLRLQASSPAINQGSASVSDYPSTDINGFSRNGSPDIGAYEFYPASAPVFSSATSFSAAENQTGVGTITATDANGDALTYSISGGLDQSLFTINATTGVLVFNSAPDYENAGDNGGDNIYNLTIQVSDGSLTATQNLTITVTDVNENAPNSAPSGLSTSGNLVMQENEAVGTIVGTFQAQDPDGDSLTYTLVSGVGDGNNSMFTLENNGTLKTAVIFDYELYSSLSIRVSVSDGVNPGVEGNFTVTITDVNETPANSAPVFSSASSFSAAENQTSVGTVTATDANGDALTYSISGGLDQSLFTINGTTGVLVFNSAPDYENAGDNGGDNIYNLTIQVSDGSLTATQNLTITVTDVNETPANSAPVFSSVTSFSAAENQTGVGTVTATDANGDTLTYSISGGLDQSLFTINGTTGVLVFNSAPDYENAGDNGGDNIYNLTIQVSDGSLTATQNLTITVTDVNETPANSVPVFSSATSFSAAENQTGVGTVTATDANGDTLTYSISGGLDQSLFTINGTTGVLVFNSTPDYENPLDNGTDNIYNLTIQVSDGSLTAIQNLTITVTDVNETPANSVPVFSSATSFSAAENQTGVGTVTATDANGDTLTYSISGGLDQSLFTINGTTGVLVFNSTPDYENPLDNGTDNIYNLTIQVSDGSLTATQNLTITVTDVNETPANSAPVFSSATSFSVMENQTGAGTVTATDGNGDALTFSISGGLDQSLFTINGTTGVLVFNSAPDYENPLDNGTDNIYNLTILVSDGSLTATQNLTITVTDVNETPANSAPVFSSATSFSAVENQTGVGTVTATDGNGDALTFSISGGLDQSLFTINPTTGVLVFNSAPDYENPLDNGTDNIYNLTIQVSDGSLTATQNLTITVTDVNETPANSAPVFSSATSFSVSENQTGVGTVTATDANGDALTYSISGGLDQSLFTINATTGVLVFNSAPDYENAGDNGGDNVYNLTIQVSDGSLTATQNLAITVTDVNETPANSAPVFSSATSFSVSENQTGVGTVTATDTNGDALTYSISGGLDQSLFTINGTTGVLVFNSAPDYENAGDNGGDNIYNLTIQVSDGSLTATQNLTITVTDVNETPANSAPVFSSATSFSVMENQTGVGTVTATDANGDALTFSITGGLDQSLFTINGTTGVLVFNSAPDYENAGDNGGNNIYNLTIQISDGSLNAIQNITINLTDVDESMPNDPNNDITTLAPLQVKENLPVGTVVSSFEVANLIGDELLYYLSDGEGGQNNSKFLLEMNGTLRTAEVFDYESYDSLFIRVNVINEYNQIKTAKFQISVLDELEVVPNQSPYQLSAVADLQVKEKEISGAHVGTFTAKDPDGDDLSFSLVQGLGDGNNSLFIMDKNGSLTTGQVMDLAAQEQLSLRIAVDDGKEGRDEGVFIVEILKTSEPNKDEFYEIVSSELRVEENSPIGTIVGEFSVISSNNLSYDGFSFDLNSSLFEINQKGELVTMAHLDYENSSKYDLLLEVVGTNQDGAHLSNSFLIEIIDLNETSEKYPPYDILLEGNYTAEQNEFVAQKIGSLIALDQDQDDLHVFSIWQDNNLSMQNIFYIDKQKELYLSAGNHFDSNQSINLLIRGIDNNDGFVEKEFRIDVIVKEEPGESVVDLTEGVDIGYGWKRAGWFGQYFSDFLPWIYHTELGWCFVEQKSAFDVWFYHDRLKWVWTNSELFPFLFIQDQNKWVFLDREAWPTRIFDYESYGWYELNRKYEVSISNGPLQGGVVRGLGSYNLWDEVTIQATPNNGFEFAGWGGDFSGEKSTVQIKILDDFQVMAYFRPIIEPATSPSQTVTNIGEIVDTLEDLNVQEKQKATAELLIFGKSSSAGIDLTE